MKRFVLLIGIVMSLTGCASIMGEKVDSKVAFQGGGEKNFTFVKKAGDTPILKSDIEESFLGAFETASLYKLAEFSDSEMWSDKRYIGVEVNKTAEGIEVAHYDNFGDLQTAEGGGGAQQDNPGDLLRSQKATYTLDISETPAKYLVKMTCPSEYNDYATLRGGALDSEPFVTHEEVVKNYVHICNAAAPVVEKVEYIKGEFNSRLSGDKVLVKFANHFLTSANCPKKRTVPSNIY